jgi:hypothetical protein
VSRSRSIKVTIIRQTSGCELTMAFREVGGALTWIAATMPTFEDAERNAKQFADDRGVPWQEVELTSM